MRVAAIVAAGGPGTRLGAPVPKPFVDLGGRSLLQRSVEAFDACPQVDELVVVLPAAWVDHPAAQVRAHKPLVRVAGGARRQDSVACGFACLSAQVDFVLVHDAARPFVTPALIARTLAAAVEAGAAVPALSPQDTVKEAAWERPTERDAQGSESETGVRPLWVARTLPREALRLVQTPQAFRRDVLGAGIALGQRGLDATDEAMLVERAGYPVRLVEGDRDNIKITTPLDLAFARWLVDVRDGGGTMRVGMGYDVHPLVAGRPLVLGGITIPFDRGPGGHSDGDAICHAVIDAVLGAATAGDIGQQFPDTDPRWQNASSLDLLARARRVVQERGFRVENVDVVVLLEAPKIGPYVPQMRAALADALEVDETRVSVKGKTHEGLGVVGRGAAVVAHAVALVSRVG